jgi:hypothetical protein
MHPDMNEFEFEVTDSARSAEMAMRAIDAVGVRMVPSQAPKDLDPKSIVPAIVPSLWHFARLPGLQDAMRQHIEFETGARIWVVQGQGR